MRYRLPRLVFKEALPLFLLPKQFSVCRGADLKLNSSAFIDRQTAELVKWMSLNLNVAVKMRALNKA